MAKMVKDGPKWTTAGQNWAQIGLKSTKIGQNGQNMVQK